MDFFFVSFYFSNHISGDCIFLSLKVDDVRPEGDRNCDYEKLKIKCYVGTVDDVKSHNDENLSQFKKRILTF